MGGRSRLCSWVQSHPSLIANILSFVDVTGLCRSDTAIRSHRDLRESFLTVLKNAHIPALSNYGFAVDDLTRDGMGAALQWAVKREVDLQGFVFKVKYYESGLFAAVDKGMRDLTELLLTKGLFTGDGGMSGLNEGEYGLTAPLHQAVYRQRVDLVSLLLSHGADPDARDNSHYTALQGACSDAHHPGIAYELAKALIRGNCDLNVVDAAGQTPLIWEAAKGRSNMVGLLLEHGHLDVDAVDEIGSSALYYASKNNNVLVVEKLLKAGATVDIRNANGRTSLHAAARRGHAEVCKLLVRHGASIDAEDSDGKTPWRYVAHHAGPSWRFLEPPPPPPPPSESSP